MKPPRAATFPPLGAALLGFLVLLAWGGMHPARAQNSGGGGGGGGHVHQWAAGDAPEVNELIAAHLGGRPITTSDPALPCEVIQVWAHTDSCGDNDLCTAPGCPLMGTQANGAVKVERLWDEVVPGGLEAPGHFVEGPTPPIQNREFTDPTDGKLYGTGGGIGPFYYRVSREHTSGTQVRIDCRVDDEGPVWDPVAGQSVPGFNDPINPDGAGTEFFVQGTRCWIPPATGESAGELSVCHDAGKQSVGSDVVPASGNLTFTVPVTSWGYRGTTLNFALTYNSRSALSPAWAANQPRHPAALSDDESGNHYNPKWTHTYAQWIEVAANGTAVWNRGDGTRMGFGQSWPGGQGPVWTRMDSEHTLTSTGEATSPAFRFEDDLTQQWVPYGAFTLKDGDGTEHRFDQVRWNLSPTPEKPVGYAIPYFLLTRITDRWGRVVHVTWGAGGTGPITAVTDGNGRGLTFTYANGLLAGVTDPAGRTHLLSHSEIATPSGPTQPKLTSVTVQGVGAPHRTQYQWSFGYTGAGYGGTYTGDLVTTKTEPSGKVVHYEHEPVDLYRPQPEDWDGRLTRCWYQDDLANPPVTRQVVRSGSTLLYDNGTQLTFGYTGHRITTLTHDNTGAARHFAYDDRNNLVSVRTDLEFSPLVNLVHTYGGASGNQILTTTATDLLGQQAVSAFNSLNLPTEVRAVGDGTLPDQVTKLEYDGGGPLTVGNLTRVITAWGRPLAEAADLAYGDPNFPGLPTAVTDSLGRTAGVTYLYPDGSPRYAGSPENLVAPLGDPDRNPSVTGFEQNAEELPFRVTDALGHARELTYCAEFSGSPNLVITARNLADNSLSRVTLNADGQVIEAVDANGIVAKVDYNRAGQPTRVRRAVGTAHERTLLYGYTPQGDLAWFDPPGGPAGRVQLEYCRYDIWYPGQPPQKAEPEIYTGQVTRIRHPDGTSEYTGYNGADEPVWSVGRDGRLVTLERDALHRVFRVNFPETPGYPAFSIETQRDVFGRAIQSMGPTGTGTAAYDDLNRPTQVTPAAGQGATLQYLKEPVLKRHISRITVTGAGTWEYRGDGKGRTAQVLNPFNQLTNWKFDLEGKTLRETRSNGTWTDSSYTNRDWLAQIEHRFADGSLLDRFQYHYTDALGVYDPTGHLRREVDAQGQTHGFAYNELYEVIGESHPDFGTRWFTYDPNGNRRSKALVGGATEWAGYDSLNRLLWTNEAADSAPLPGQTQPYRTFGYDLNGQPTSGVQRDAAGVTNRAYAWDGMGKLRSLVATGALPENYSAEYDGGGMRARATRNGVLSTYSFGLLEETAGVGNTVYTPGVSQRKAGVDRFFHSDWIGSSRYLTDSTGLSTPTAYRFEAYGGLSASLGPDSTSSKFAGGHGYESDGPAGMQLLGHRYYDPGLGRFLNPDPIGFAGGLNVYAYCGGNPVGRVDPSGLDFFDAEEYSDDEILHGGRLSTRRLLSGAFHSGDMAYVNGVHRSLGLGGFKSGNRPLAMDAFNVHSMVGQAGGGGPMMCAVGGGVFRGGGATGGGPNFFQRVGAWFGRWFRRPPPGDDLVMGLRNLAGRDPNAELLAKVAIDNRVAGVTNPVPKLISEMSQMPRIVDAARSIHFNLEGVNPAMLGDLQYATAQEWQYITRTNQWRKVTLHNVPRGFPVPAGATVR